tara:strand:- start:11740 stop:12243 length:504 start_codon:yes stop_codon:yes gene_type:complete
LKKFVKNRIKEFVILLVISLSFTKCEQEKGYSAYQSIGEEGLGTSPIIFEIPENVLDTLRKNIFLRLRNNNNYQYSNIFLIVSLTAGEEQITNDTLEYLMASPEGKWLGKGFLEVKESKLWWKESVIFPEERPIKINISQAVRNNNVKSGVENLKGIVSVGISIENE